MFCYTNTGKKGRGTYRPTFVSVMGGKLKQIVKATHSFQEKLDQKPNCNKR